MSQAAWISFFSYNLITSITPGPMNIIAMNVAGIQGLRKSRSVFAGLILGLAAVLLLCGLFSASLAAMLPNMVETMKYIGSGYILWIAFVILRSRPGGGTDRATALNFNRSFLLQFINIKAYIWAITVYSAYVLPNGQGLVRILSFAGLMLLIAVLCAMVWAASGALLSAFLQKHWRLANAVMALMLLYSAVSLLMD